MKKSALIIFTKNLSEKDKKRLQGVSQFGVVIAPLELQKEIQSLGNEQLPLEDLVGAGSIYDASSFAQELSLIALPNGSRVTKSFLYEGFELWWIHHDRLYLNFCFPYSQYKHLLEYLKDYESVYLYKAPCVSLFSHYLEAHKCKLILLGEPRMRVSTLLPLGIILQILITVLSLPVLIFRRQNLMVFIGDRLEETRDYDFRMKFIYRELREKNLQFVEFIRSLMPWKTVLRHFFIRRRPVIYSEGIIFIGQFLSVISGRRRSARKQLDNLMSATENDPQKRFRFLVTTQYLGWVHDDIYAIRIMKWILSVIHIKSACITSATERNFHTVLGCKLNHIPTVGIMHGVQPKDYTMFDFLPTFDGEKSLSVDTYGVWSE